MADQTKPEDSKQQDLQQEQPTELIQDTETEEAEEDQEIISDHYEICYIVSATLTVNEVKPIDEKVKKLIEENNGQITKKDDLGKLKFAYPIKKQSHGYYHLLEFDLPKSNLKSLQDSLILIHELARFLIVKKKIKTAAEIKEESALQEKLAKRKEQAIEKIQEEKKEAKEKPTKKEEKGKISLEDLDKKLDEILDTDEML